MGVHEHIHVTVGVYVLQLLRYNVKGVSFYNHKCTISLKTSLIPLYIPGGAIWRRDFKTSGAIAIIQLAIPPIPPANMIRTGLS